MKERPILFNGAMVRAILAGTKTQTRRAVKPQPPEECTHIGPVMGTYSGISVPRWYWRTADDFEQAEALGKEYVYWPAASDEDGDGFTGDVYGLGGMECPYGTRENCLKKADLLWVRETFYAWGRWETRYSAKKGRDEWHFVDMTTECGKAYAYAADGGQPQPMAGRRDAGTFPKWWRRPAIFMPRAASRITLEVTSVRVERLGSISAADAKAEGVEGQTECGPWRNYLRDGYWFPEGKDNAPQLSFASLWHSINGAGNWQANPWVWAVSFERIDT